MQQHQNLYNRTDWAQFDLDKIAISSRVPFEMWLVVCVWRRLIIILKSERDSSLGRALKNRNFGLPRVVVFFFASSLIFFFIPLLSFIIIIVVLFASLFYFFTPSSA